MTRVIEHALPHLLVCFSMCLFACGYSANEPLPEVKRRPEVAECSFPAPAALQVAGEDIEAACRPDSGGLYFADVGLTISAEGYVSALRIGQSTTASVAKCIRKVVPSMRFLVVDPCHTGAVEIDLAFGGGGVS